MQVAVELAGVQLTREGELGRVVDDAVERLGGEGWEDLVAVAEDPGDLRRVKELGGPGVAAGDGERRGIELDGDHPLGAAGGLAGGVAEAGRGVEDVAGDRGDGADLGERVVVGVRALDPVHRDAGDKHRRGAGRRVESVDAVG